MDRVAVAFHTVGHKLRIAIRGELDFTSREEVLGRLVPAVVGTTGRLVELDLSGVTFLDAAGVGTLIAAYHAAEARGLALHISGAAGTVQQILEVTGATDVLRGADESTPDPPAGDGT